MADFDTLEDFSVPSTTCSIIGKTNQRYKSVLNEQKDKIILLCTKIIHDIVTNVIQLQEDYDPKNKGNKKKHLRRSEHERESFVCMLTDGLRKLRGFSEDIRRYSFNISNQYESLLSFTGGDEITEHNHYRDTDEKLSYISESLLSFKGGDEITEHNHYHDTDVKLLYDSEETTEKGLFVPLDTTYSSHPGLTEEVISNNKDTHHAENVYEPIPFFKEPIDLELLEVQDVIGVGQFGEVRKGILHFTTGDTSAKEVAVKVLKDTNRDQEEDFKNEVAIMSKLAHLNIVAFIGTKEKMIVMEYADLGSLKRYIVTRSKNNPLHVNKMIQICIDVAKGMKYLADLRIVHGDLAARNVLLTSDFQAKITDFGLSRCLDEGTSYYKKSSKENLPVWWCPLEVLKKQIFSTKSDVWSFGVFMWEVFTHGKTPILCSRVEEMVCTLEKKIRLQKSDNCPTIVYSLMSECWKDTPMDRPDFDMIWFQLRQILDIQIQEEIFDKDDEYATVELPPDLDYSAQYQYSDDYSTFFSSHSQYLQLPTLHSGMTIFKSDYFVCECSF